jgi:hypothetical protein
VQSPKVSALDEMVTPSWEGSRTGPAKVRCRHQARRSTKAAVTLWTTKELAQTVDPTKGTSSLRVALETDFDCCPGLEFG